MADDTLPKFSRHHRQSAKGMGIAPGELAKRQASNRARKRDAKAARLLARAQAAGVSVAEMRQQIEKNKAKAATARRIADRRRDLMDEVELLLAEVKWRGAVIGDADRAVLQAATSKKGFRTVGEEAAAAAIKRVADAIDALALANAKRILSVALGGKETLQ